MKKIITSCISIVLLLLIFLITILLTIGIETNKFNEFIYKKVSQAKNIDLDLLSKETQFLHENFILCEKMKSLK